MPTYMLCMRRLAIVAAMTGALLIAIAGADLCATGVVSAGGTCAGYGAAALTFLGL